MLGHPSPQEEGQVGHSGGCLQFVSAQRSNKKKLDSGVSLLPPLLSLVIGSKTQGIKGREKNHPHGNKDQLHQPAELLRLW